MMPRRPLAALTLPRARGPLVWACAMAVALTATLLIMRGVLLPRDQAPYDWRAAERARELDAVSRELGTLLHELETQPPHESIAERALWETRVANDLHPRVSEFRRRLLAIDHDNAAHHSLLRAADRLGAAVSNPSDARALKAARAAWDDAQEQVRADLADSRRP